jgi:phosphonate transport system permease protein
MKTYSITSINLEELGQIRSQWPHAFPPGGPRKMLRSAAFFLIFGLLVGGLVFLEFSFIRLWAGVGKLFQAVTFMFPPSSGGYFHLYFKGMLETIAMAFLGTVFSSIASVPLGFLGAKNIISNRFFHFGLRRVFDFVRGLDSLIWALVFVNAVGLGPLAGILAIAVNDSGTLSKLFAEAIENVDREQIKGIRATGAGPLQVVVFAYIPQILPIMLSNSLYFFESNVRSATILGIVGAGGIGTYLADRLRVLEWQQACLIIIMILITVLVIDNISRILRVRFIGRASLSS